MILGEASRLLEVVWWVEDASHFEVIEELVRGNGKGIGVAIFFVCIGCKGPVRCESRYVDWKGSVKSPSTSKSSVPRSRVD